MSSHKRRAKPGKEEEMKTVVTAFAVAALCLCAWAADNAAVDTRPTANHQSLVARHQSLGVITIPQMLSYQGKLTDTLGQPVPNGSYPMMFLLYTVPSGGSAFWSENQSVTTKGGLFSVLLGSATPIGSIPSGGAVYLAMTVSGGPELAPRQRIVSAAYAYKADTANYAVSSAILRPISPALSGTEIAKPCTLDASVPGSAVLRIRNSAAGEALRIDSAGGNGEYIAHVGGSGVRVHASNNGLVVDTAGWYGLVVYSADTGDAIFSDSSGSHAMYAGICNRGFGVAHALDIGVLAWADTIGGQFSATTAAGVGVAAHAYNNAVNDTAIQAYGRGYATGGWYTGGLYGNKETPCLVSPELGIVSAGTASLVGDEATVPYPQILSASVRTDVPVRVTVTPRGEPAGVLYVSGADANGFRVSLKRIPGWDSKAGVTFDWIAFGSLKGYETSPKAKAEWDKAIRDRDEGLRMRRAQLGR